MSTRWLKGILLFALGCASAMLVKPVETRAAAAGGETVEGELTYINGNDFRLTYPRGEADYVVVVQRKAGKGRTTVSSQTGSAVISKKDLQSLIVYRLDPRVVIQSSGNVLRCARWDDQCPLPPPPPPDALVMFLRPTAQGPALPIE
jgi:hypothetical protein